jgi:hypothetical protein
VLNFLQNNSVTRFIVPCFTFKQLLLTPVYTPERFTILTKYLREKNQIKKNSYLSKLMFQLELMFFCWKIFKSSLLPGGRHNSLREAVVYFFKNYAAPWKTVLCRITWRRLWVEMRHNCALFTGVLSFSGWVLKRRWVLLRREWNEWRRREPDLRSRIFTLR